MTASEPTAYGTQRRKACRPQDAVAGMHGYNQTDAQQAPARLACSQVFSPQWRAALLPDGDPSSHVLKYIISLTGCRPLHAAWHGRRHKNEGFI